MTCIRLKEENQKKNENENEKKQESAHVTVETDVALQTVSTPNTKTWSFDSCASSHMTSNIELFETPSTDHGTVEVGSFSG